MKKTIAFIGAGNMGGAIARAVCGAISPSEVVIYDIIAEKANTLAAETGCCVAGSGCDAVLGAKYVMLCVKPQYYAQVLSDLLPALKQCAEAGNDQVLMSIVTGAKISSLREIMAQASLALPTLRIMPNTPAAIGQGVLLLSHCDRMSEADYHQATELLSSCGRLVQMSEPMLDIATPVSGCTPAFTYMFIEALSDGAVQIGVPRDQAIMLAAQAVLGSAAMVLESGLHPGALKDAVCSPGGSTIVGVSALEENGFRHAAIQAIVAAYTRNCQLG